MINKEIFNTNDLIKAKWQYDIRHQSSKCFTLGEKVFLKSNPEILMTVHSLYDESVICYWCSIDGQIQLSEFPYQCVLQYKFRSLRIYYDKYKICLN